MSRLAPGERKVLDVGGEKTAVHRDDNGEVHAVSPVCTHMAPWSTPTPAIALGIAPATVRAWGTDGRVLHGPAKRPLKTKQVSVEGTPSAPDAA